MSDSCNPIDCSLPGSSVHGISQSRILKWVAISFSRGSSWSRDKTWVSCIAGRFFTDWATREAHSFYHHDPLTHQPAWYTCAHLVPFHNDSETDHLTILDQWNTDNQNTNRGLIRTYSLGIGVSTVMLSLGTQSYYLKRSNYPDWQNMWIKRIHPIPGYSIHHSGCEIHE